MQPPVLISRKARLWPSISSEAVVLPSAPTLPARPSPLTLFTALLGLLGGILFGGLYAFTGGGSGILILAFMGMSVLAGVGSLVAYVMQRREVRRNTEMLLNMYEKALDEKEEQLSRLYKAETEAWLSIEPPLPLREPLDERDTHLWDHRPDDPDFLAVRLGIGDRPATFTLQSEERNHIVLPPASQRLMQLEQRCQQMRAKYARVPAPRTVALGDYASIGITGVASRKGLEQARVVARTMLAHLMYRHSPEDVRIVILAPASQQKRWVWASNLPHTLTYAAFPDVEQGSTHTVALGSAAIMEQLSLLSRELSRRELLLGDERHITPTTPLPLPRLIIVVDHFDSNSDLEKQMSMGVMDFSRTKETTGSRHLLTVSPLQRPELTMALSHGRQLGVTVVSICMGEAFLPATCGLVIDLSGLDQPTSPEVATDMVTRQTHAQAVFYLVQPDPPPAISCEILDYLSLEDAARFAAFMRPLRPVIAKRPQLRTQVDIRTLFELPTELSIYDPAERWHMSERVPIASLRVPIGQKMGDELHYLDLLKDGPHGLLIGQTGSGKSELLQTIIMAFALAYSPQQVNFLLIDYKAGLALEPFAQLPHTIGFLSNISSASQIQRFITMLRAEALRRQNLEREHKPMPRLLIIIDEFAQMIGQTESVLDEIFTITRLGRQIGMHLLLGAQRPEGVIGSKVRDYVQYRLCLRVTSAEDSREVLGRVDAAQLPASIPGRGYMLHGDNQLDLFQAARTTLPVEGGTTMTLRAMSGQKKTVADVLIERCVASYPCEQARKNGITYWPEPLPFPGTLIPDPLVLFATATEAIQGGSQQEVPSVRRSLLVVPAQTVVASRHKEWMLREFLWQGQEITETALSFPLGLVDMPAEQKSIPFCVDLHGVADKVSGGPLLIAGVAGSGKATALQTMLLWFITRYTARSLRCIVIDPDHDLDLFHNLPHLYDEDGTHLYTSGESDDELQQFIDHVAAMLSKRQQSYNQHRWGEQMLSQLRLRGEVPILFLVVSNYQSFAARYMVNTNLKELVIKFTEARKLGANVVLTTSSLGGGSFPSDLIARMGTRLGLFFDEDQRYALFGRRTPSVMNIPGRGLAMLRDCSMYEVQLALPVAGNTEKERNERLKMALEELGR